MDIKINNLLSFPRMDYWDSESQLTADNRHLLKENKKNNAPQAGSAQ